MKIVALLLSTLYLCNVAAAQSLVRNVTIISMVDERQPMAANMDVLIEAGRFKTISPTGTVIVPEKTTVVDGTGLFMIPGLADCHVHFDYEGANATSESQYVRENNDVLLKLFVAHGVTFVRSMWGSPKIVELRQRCNSGELIGPTIWTTGPLLTGNSTPPARTLETDQDVEDILREHKAAGYDAFKIHSSPNPGALRSLFAKAIAAGIPVYGHMPFTADRMEMISQPGLTTIEHLSTLLGACVRDDSDALKSNWPGMMRMYAEQDPAKHKSWATIAAESGKWFCPTMMAYVTDQNSSEEYNQLLDELSGKYVTRETINYWRNAVGYEKQAYEKAGIDLLSLYQAPCDLMAAFIAADVPVIAGTDTPARPGVAGKLLHRELLEYVRLGMTPYQALQTATTHAAQAVGQANEFGRIAPGYRADAVLLQANPLDDIGNLTQIDSVLLRGQVLNRSTIDKLLEEVGDTVHDTRVSMQIPEQDGDSDQANAQVRIENVAVVDPSRGRTTPDQTILVQGERITWVGPTADVPSMGEMKTVDGSGLFAVPGLIDSHVHLNSPVSDSLLMVLNGVVLARDMGGATRNRLELRRRGMAGELNGLRLLVTGTILDGDPPYHAWATACATAEQGREAVQALAKSKVDQIKVYSQLKPEVYEAIVDEAHKLGLPVVGHVPDSVEFSDALNIGQATVEHFSKFETFFADSVPAAYRSRSADGLFASGLWPGYEMISESEKNNLLLRLKQSGVAMCPTLGLYEAQARIQPDEKQQSDWEEFSKDEIPYWETEIPAQWQTYGDSLKLSLPSVSQALNDLHNANVPLLVGTDLGNFGILAGCSVHYELRLWQKAGIPPIDLLKYATSLPAEIFKVDGDYGAIEKGKLASFFLCRNDPLENIAHLSSIEALVLNGVYSDAAAVRAMEKKVRQIVQSQTRDPKKYCDFQRKRSPTTVANTN